MNFLDFDFPLAFVEFLKVFVELLRGHRVLFIVSLH